MFLTIKITVLTLSKSKKTKRKSKKKNSKILNQEIVGEISDKKDFIDKFLSVPQ